MSRRPRNLSPTFHYDQSRVLSENITRYVREHSCRSLLDIGAGSGPVAIVISREVETYCAVEANEESAEKLRAAGLEVIGAHFPVAIATTFDIVLSSHSLPEGDCALYEPFLRCAWELVNPGGVLLLITFKGTTFPIEAIANRMRQRNPGVDRQYEETVRVLRTFGPARSEVVDSHVTTKQFDDLKQYFGNRFWRTPDEEERYVQAFEREMNENFRVGDRYEIATPHLFLSVAKPR